MKLSFHGAARSVTGSRHLLEMPGNRILLDCGLFQGQRQEADRQNRFLGFDPRSIQAVLLSHAHIDHSGALPVLGKHQFRGNVHMTRATVDLAAVMLEDSARLQENDCAYLNKKENRRGKRCLQPFYESRDARAIIRRFVGARYGDTIKVTPRVTASFHDVGHILGSAAIRLKYSARGNSTTVLFSGDLGRSQMPILRDPAPPPSCDVLIIESTYGDRLHEEAGEALTQKAQQLVAHAKAHKSKIIVPAFALGRTQDLVMRIKRLVAEGRIDPLPIYIDSPLASKVTDVFRKHPECYDEETFRTFTSEGDPFAARYIRYVSSPEESKRLNEMKGPCVIIASSGMCEDGMSCRFSGSRRRAVLRWSSLTDCRPMRTGTICLRTCGRSLPPLSKCSWSTEKKNKPCRWERPSRQNTPGWLSWSRPKTAYTRSSPAARAHLLREEIGSHEPVKNDSQCGTGLRRDSSDCLRVSGLVPRRIARFGGPGPSPRARIGAAPRTISARSLECHHRCARGQGRPGDADARGRPPAARTGTG